MVETTVERKEAAWKEVLGVRNEAQKKFAGRITKKKK